MQTYTFNDGEHGSFYNNNNNNNNNKLNLHSPFQKTGSQSASQP